VKRRNREAPECGSSASKHRRLLIAAVEGDDNASPLITREGSSRTKQEFLSTDPNFRLTTSPFLASQRQRMASPTTQGRRTRQRNPAMFGAVTKSEMTEASIAVTNSGATEPWIAVTNLRVEQTADLGQEFTSRQNCGSPPRIYEKTESSIAVASSRNDRPGSQPRIWERRSRQSPSRIPKQRNRGSPSRI
jgi:hypothetical protein